jgi:DNA-binding transcriptional LysR family regulator
MFDLRRVRVFHEVAERQSVSAATDALGYIQPSVSHQLAALERELGQRLVNRETRRPTRRGSPSATSSCCSRSR